MLNDSGQSFVVRLDNPTRSEFVEQAVKGRPIVVSGALNDWSCVNWTFKQLVALAATQEKQPGHTLQEQNHVLATATGMIPDYVRPPPDTIHAPADLDSVDRPETMSKHSIMLSELCERIDEPQSHPPLLCTGERSVHESGM